MRLNSSAIKNEVDAISLMLELIVIATVPLSDARCVTDDVEVSVVASSTSSTSQELQSTLTDTIVPSLT